MHPVQSIRVTHSLRHATNTALLLLTAALLGACSRGAEAPKAASGPPEVGVITLQTTRQTYTTELTGRTVAFLSADIRPQVGGIIQKRSFTEGANVRAGDVLYQIDPAPFEATLGSAEAALARARATAESAQATARRNAELVKIDAVSQQVNEQSQAAMNQARADVAVAEATVQTARINLGYTRITSPIPGRVAISSVTPGALVTANQTAALTTVQQIDPIYVDVTQTSAEVLRLKRELAAGRLTRSGGADAARMRIVLEDGSLYGREGRLQFAGIAVNPTTGAITLRGTVANPDGLLLPGMYVRAVIEEGVDEQALLVPQQGITRDATGRATALVVGADDKVVRRNVTVDRAVGNRWVVRQGLAAGERVIIEGVQRARVGELVRTVAVQAPEAPRGVGAPAVPGAPSAPVPAKTN
ncbi:efflux RND transporter periplasmic adaptor subunit [Variovorax sp. VNK109]|uniref:efflux RND transporter periplasmic adaptor subunit n=1 Tax=Variovorax sp. VNK109 TaxID=3400919 RepID=UPI003C0139E3